MRTIIANAFVSLDGVMQAPGGANEDSSGGFDLGGWNMKYAAEKSGAAIMGLVGTLAKPNDLLLGRRTYDIFAGYWPHAPRDNPIGPVFTKASKYVMTGGTGELGWANTHSLRSIEELKKVKSGDGPDIVLWGSSTLYPQLLEASLIDRLVLLISPLVLGKGKKLFGNTPHPVAMKLVNSEATSTGVIMATYEVSCAPAT